jgi:hypothetical protein
VCALTAQARSCKLQNLHVELIFRIMTASLGGRRMKLSLIGPLHFFKNLSHPGVACEIYLTEQERNFALPFGSDYLVTFFTNFTVGH